jgi:hypothetical protein
VIDKDVIVKTQTTLLLNVGLTIGQTGQAIDRMFVLHDLARHFDLRAFRYFDAVKGSSATEPTVVAEVEASSLDAALKMVARLSSSWGQDCVALYQLGSKSGWLVGPNAEAWGAFNPAFFLTMTGDTLAPGLDALRRAA